MEYGVDVARIQHTVIAIRRWIVIGFDNADRHAENILRRGASPQLLFGRGGEPGLAGDRQPDGAAVGKAFGRVLDRPFLPALEADPRGAGFL